MQKTSPPNANDEAIAIVGIGCRLPGDVSDPRAFWRILCEGLDLVEEVPPERFDAAAYHHPDRSRAGTMYTRAAAMLKDIDQFDAAFFRIAPQEASRIDPQHRLLLEVSWECLEDAGQPASALLGRRIGVFIGQSFQDYLSLQLRDPHSENAYTMMGGASCMAANRISYFLDLRGPSVTIDTACASGLTAVHAACQSIWSGESAMALAGGVNISLLPGGFVGFSRAQMLSPVGRCQAFSEDADGYVRGEGCGVVLLKPLSQALRDGDRIYAAVRATGINHHGHTQGITFPGAAAQEELLRTVLARAGLAARDIQYVEAHGTGTQAGDPVEAQAIGRALGAGRPDGEPLRIGSAKTNVGHPEAAAGIIGFIKLALALKHRHIPASLHAERTNPAIPFAELGLRVAATAEQWPISEGLACGMVSAFGFGGANACALLQEVAPVPAVAAMTDPGNAGPFLLPLSARTQAALSPLLLSYVGLLREPALPMPQDLCHSAALRRDHHEHRSALVFRDLDDLQKLLAAQLRGESPVRCCSGRARAKTPKVAFAFCGNGPQWWAMGRQLLAAEPAFRETVERCARSFSALSNYDLLRELCAPEDNGRMTRTDIAQPAIYALQLGLCELFASWGIRPDAVIGHSAGEGAAAYIAGALDFEDAARIIYHRSRTQHRTLGSGRLAAAGLSLDEAERLVRPFAGRVCVSAHNSARQVTFSGELAALRELGQQVEASGAFWREIPMDYAFHSRAMDVVREDLWQSIADIRAAPPHIPFYSTVTGCREQERPLDAEYWWANLRQPVLFAPAAEALLRDGFDIVIEIGPHPVLRTYLNDAANLVGADAMVLPSLRRKEDESEQLLSTLGALYTAGCAVNFERYSGGRLIPLPTHPFVRERHWNEPAIAAGPAGAGRIVHPLLGRRVAAQRPEWQVELDLDLLPWLRDHVLGGAVIVPGAAYLEQALAVAAEALGGAALAVEQVEIDKPLLVVAGTAKQATVLFSPESSSFEVRSGPEGQTLHAKGEVAIWQGSLPPRLDMTAVRAACIKRLDREEAYERLSQRGIVMSASFRGIQELWLREGEALAAIALPEVLAREEEAGRRYRFHPALLDACLQVTVAVAPAGMLAHLPIAVERLIVYRPVPVRLWSHVRLVRKSGRILCVDLAIADEHGEPVARIEGFTTKEVDLIGQRAEDLLHALTWEPRPRRSAEAAAPIVEPAATLAASAIPTSGHALTQLIEYRDQTLPKENALCSAYVIAALSRLGWRPQRGDRVAAPSLLRELGIAGRYLRQLHRMLEFLGEDGILRLECGEEWTVLSAPPRRDITAEFQALWSSSGAAHAQIELTHRVGLRLDQILRGECDPLSLLFPEIASAGMEEIYDSSSVQYYGNTTARAVLHRILDHLPPGRRIEALEIGAGTGGLTAWLLPLIQSSRGRYRFTDLSDAFIQAARARFHEFDFVEYDTLNIEEPEPRHLSAPVDLIFASNVFHATRDVRETLLHVKELLRPGGCAVFIELSPGVRAVELVYGLLPGWWRRQDRERRPAGPLLPPAAWQAAARECGFAEVELATERTLDGVMSVVVARSAAPAKVRQEAGEARLVAAEAPLFVVLKDEGGLGERLAKALERSGARCLLAAARGEEDLERAFTEAGKTLHGIVHLAALDARAEDDPAAALRTVSERGCLATAQLMRALSRQRFTKPPQLWLVTRGARQLVEEERPCFAQAALWGLGRSAMLEHKELRCTLLDLDPACSGDEVEAERLAAELLLPEEAPLEQALALRGEGRLVERLAKLAAQEAPRELHPERCDVSFRLESTRPGVLCGLDLVAVSRSVPGLDEVEIEVHAAALNFRDLMLALDMLPSRESPPLLGLECSGRITAVGPGVTRFQIGDEVMAASSGTFGRYVVAPVGTLLRKPTAWSHPAAATIPASFATAVYGLHHLGRMRRGERLLVHGAAGGLGLTAVQLAKRAGVKLYATAGTPEKRELLRELGADFVADSRAPDFAERILAEIKSEGGQGVDLVLNSLSGSSLAKSLSLLKPLGRFIEVGKRDFFINSRLGWRLLQQRSHHAVDLDKIMADAPELYQEIVDELQARLAAGEIAPLPHRVFPLSRAAEAFKTMQRSRHIGKLVVEIPEPRLRVRPLPRELCIRRDGTYVITGGLGGLGLSLAAWLAKQGAGCVALLGRREPTTEQTSALAEIERAGTRVFTARCDVGDAASLAQLLAELRRTAPPLRGIVHAALVLDDALLVNLSHERLEKVMGPKARGALNLHAQTLADPIELFLCCSSVAGLLGNAGQAIYGAANAFVDALCEHRRALGLPALSVSLGAISDVGFVARTPGLAEALRARGMHAAPASEILEALRGQLATARPHIGLFRYDWSRYPARSSSLVVNLIRPDSGAAPDREAQRGGDGKEDLRARLRSVNGVERRGLLRQRLSWHIGRILGLSGERIDPEAPIASLGMDSLMAVDLHRFIESSLGADVPVMSILQGWSLAQLVSEVDQKLEASGANP